MSVEKMDVAVAVVQFKGKILLLKRGHHKKYFPNKWENAGGKINKHETPEEAVIREVKEETGLNGKILRRGRTYDWLAEDVIFHIIPFLFEAASDDVKLSEEHSDCEWVDIENYVNFDHLDGLEMDYKSLDMI